MSGFSAERDALDRGPHRRRTIQATIRSLDEVSGAIAAAVEEQSAVTREMSGSMQTAAHGATTIASGMEDIARASEQVDQATRKVRQASQAAA
jgi:methyl-accepting chemotaxis protein